MKETFENYLQRLKDRRTEDDYKYTDEDFIQYEDYIMDSWRCGISVYKCLEFMYFAEKEIQPEQIWNDEKKKGVKELIDKHKQEISTKLHKGEVIDESYPKEFKHEFKVLTKEEVMEGRSSAYEFIDFDKQETLEEAAERILWDNTGMLIENHPSITQSMIDLAKWQSEISYSEEEVFNLCCEFATFVSRKGPSYKKQREWFEQFKKK